MRLLFVCKKNETYGTYSYTHGKRSGLYNSVRFISEALGQHGIDSRIVEVTDNNDIDRVVTCFHPDLVILEALWVVPEKFDVLMQLHPRVAWYVHLHSNIPFLASEGVAIEWLLGYVERGVGILTNSEQCFAALQQVLPGGSDADLAFLPNVYSGHSHVQVDREREVIDVGCFGAIRPMKNQLIQAIAALSFAREKGKRLRFHINSSRIETGGEPVLRNLTALFDDAPDAKLVEHHWMEPHVFVKYLHTHIDIGMQVSLSETFNIVSADYVTAGLPVVVSKEVRWVSWICQAKDDSVDSIADTMSRVWRTPLLTRRNQYLLSNYSEDSLEKWLCFLQGS